MRQPVSGAARSSRSRTTLNRGWPSANCSAAASTSGPLTASVQAFGSTSGPAIPYDTASGRGKTEPGFRARGPQPRRPEGTWLSRSGR